MNDLDGGGRRMSANPRLELLRREVNEKVLEPFRLHDWSAEIVLEVDCHDCIEIAASKEEIKTRIAVLYSGLSISHYDELSNRVDRIFLSGQPRGQDPFRGTGGVPVDFLDNFFGFLVDLSKRLQPDRSPAQVRRERPRVRRLTAENPLDAVIARLQQFTSETLARKLVERRAETESIDLSPGAAEAKAAGVAYSMRSALDYIAAMPREALNKKVLGLYYGSMALAQAEMLASPSGPVDLDRIEAMTLGGHGLYTLLPPGGGFPDLCVGVLDKGFFPQWMKFLGHDISAYPKARPRSPAELSKIPEDMVCVLTDLFASVPEIGDLFAEVVGKPPGWILVAYDQEANAPRSMRSASVRTVGNTYGEFIDPSGKVAVERLERAGWPIADIRKLERESNDLAERVFRVRVDHAGHDTMWPVLPTHSSPFGNGPACPALLFPAVGGLREYRTIAVVTLYALSIMARYMPGAWRRIEGGDQDHYFVLVQTALAVWERLLPEHFLESIADETVHTAQPGSFFA